jgi:hypothetical protein
MVAVFEQYTRELRDELGYLATWLPNTRIRLGDVGKLRRDRFEYVTDLDTLSIPFEVRSKGLPSDLEYTSRGGVQINSTASGSAPLGTSLAGRTKARMSVAFKRANAVVFVARQCTSTYIANRQGLGQHVLARYEAGTWDAALVIITEIVTAAATTILISASAGAWIDFDTEASAEVASLGLADISGGLRVSGTSGIGTRIIGAAGLTPLFQAAGLRRRFLARPALATRSSSDRDRRTLPTCNGSFIFTDADYTD